MTAPTVARAVTIKIRGAVNLNGTLHCRDAAKEINAYQPLAGATVYLELGRCKGVGSGCDAILDELAAARYVEVNGYGHGADELAALMRQAWA